MIFASCAICSSIFQNGASAQKVTAQRIDTEKAGKRQKAPEVRNAGETHDTHAQNSKGSDVCNELIQRGQAYEKQQQYQKALYFYQAASVENSEVAAPYMQAIAKKVSEENGNNIRNEEIASLKRGAEAGNPDDAYHLGKFYLKINDVEAAIKMFNLASINKHSKAPYKLAVMFERGDGVSIDLTKAEEYYKIGAVNGNAKCAYIVSKLLEIEAKKNPAKERFITQEARRLKLDAASRGHIIAAVEVGYDFAATGDHVQAKRLFEKAKNNAARNTTMTVCVQQIMAYNIEAEKSKIINKACTGS
jgi:TPR repeat protein